MVVHEPSQANDSVTGRKPPEFRDRWGEAWGVTAYSQRFRICVEITARVSVVSWQNLPAAIAALLPTSRSR